MRTTFFILPVAFALSASAFDLNIGPDTVCGSNSVDCSNGFCCREGNKCDTSGSITKCGDDGTLAVPFGIGNIASAMEGQAKSAVEGVKSAINDIPVSSLMDDVQGFATAFPTSVAAQLSSLLSDKNIPTDAAGLSSLMEAIPSAARPAVSSAFDEFNSILGVSPTGSGGQPKATDSVVGGASMLGASFGSTAMVGMIWGAAAIGGAMLVL